MKNKTITVFCHPNPHPNDPARTWKTRVRTSDRLEDFELLAFGSYTAEGVGLVVGSTAFINAAPAVRGPTMLLNLVGFSDWNSSEIRILVDAHEPADVILLKVQIAAKATFLRGHIATPAKSRWTGVAGCSARLGGLHLFHGALVFMVATLVDKGKKNETGADPDDTGDQNFPVLNKKRASAFYAGVSPKEIGDCFYLTVMNNKPTRSLLHYIFKYDGVHLTPEDRSPRLMAGYSKVSRIGNSCNHCWDH